MKDEIMQKLGAVINALNHICVSGKANLTNLSGSIAVIEEVASMLNGASIIENEDGENKK